MSYNPQPTIINSQKEPRHNAEMARTVLAKADGALALIIGVLQGGSNEKAVVVYHERERKVLLGLCSMVIRNLIPASVFSEVELKREVPSQCIENPQSIGQHIRNRRLRLRLLQADVAKLLEVSEDTITGWENGRSKPQIQFYPKIIQFLGYYPFLIDEKSIGGQIKKYRIENGLSHRKLAKITSFNTRTIASWEENVIAPNLEDRMKLVIFDIVK